MEDIIFDIVSKENEIELVEDIDLEEVVGGIKIGSLYIAK